MKFQIKKKHLKTSALVLFRFSFFNVKMAKFDSKNWLKLQNMVKKYRLCFNL